MSSFDPQKPLPGAKPVAGPREKALAARFVLFVAIVAAVAGLVGFLTTSVPKQDTGAPSKTSAAPDRATSR
jgi:hypothetical protein